MPKNLVIWLGQKPTGVKLTNQFCREKGRAGQADDPAALTADGAIIGFETGIWNR